MVDNLVRHLRVIGRLWLISVQKGLAFRWQFLTDLLNEVIAVALALLLFDIAYDHAPLIGGWDHRQTMLLVGMFQLYSARIHILSATRGDLGYCSLLTRLKEGRLRWRITRSPVKNDTSFGH